MDQNGLDAICLSAEKKLHFLAAPAKYFVYACMAGCFCSLGMALAFSMAGELYASEALRGAYKLVLGGTFTLSFTMIVFAGAELFTGNVLVMAVGGLSKYVRPGQAVKLLVVCYFANLVGAAAMGGVVAATGLLGGPMGDLLVLSAAGKTALPFYQALFRGILCNVLVCLGIWCSAKVKSEVARLIILFWVVLGFAGPGYEHSIANAGIFAMACLAPQGDGTVTFAGVLANLGPVTLGNLIGGTFVGWVYWFAGRKLPRNDLSVT